VTGPRTWTLTIPAPSGKVMGTNHDHRAHWRVVHRHRQAAKQAADAAARAAGIPRLDRCHVAITVHTRQWRTTDATNLPGGSTVKAILDGCADERHICTKQCRNLPGGCPLKGQIVRVGIVASDRPEHMDVQMPRLAGLDGGPPRVVLTITELPAVNPAQLTLTKLGGR
jgi:hypothetical protein